MKFASKNCFVTIPLLSIILLLTSCSQDIQIDDLQEKVNQVAETAEKFNTQVQQANDQVQESTEVLKSGDALSLVRDIAAMKLQSNEYLIQLNETKEALEMAIEGKDEITISKLTQQLDQQLHDFNNMLENLNLRSEEVDEIRQNILHANQLILDSSLLKENIDLNKINFSILETQLGNANTEILKLASIVVQEKLKES